MIPISKRGCWQCFNVMTSWETPDLGRSETGAGKRIKGRRVTGAFYANWRQLNTALSRAVSKARETGLPVVIPPISARSLAEPQNPDKT